MRTSVLAIAGTAFFATLLLVTSTPVARAASACDDLKPDDAPIVTRRPVIGDDVRLTSGFGLRLHPLLQEKRLHTGIDWAAPTGTPVMAAGKGRVVAAGREGYYGNRVIIDHGGGWRTVYAQLSAFSVKSGDCVEATSEIGAVGNTGLSSGPHLHFEVRHDGEFIDPMMVPIQEH